MKNPTSDIKLQFVLLRSSNIKSYLTADGKFSLLKKKNKHIGFNAFLSDNYVSIWSLIDGRRSVRQICAQLQARLGIEEVLIILNHLYKSKLIKIIS